MQTCVVFYESWQMDCCGTAFQEGDSIKWLVYVCDRLNTPVQVGKIDYCYEAHDRNWTRLQVLEGKVNKIYILYQKYVPSDENPKMLYPVEGILRQTNMAKRFEKTFEGMEPDGYLVEVSSPIIRQARKEEVTFR